MATVLVTGTNRGIGLEFVRQFAERGDKVIATCRNLKDAVQLQEFKAAYPAIRLMELDVANSDSLKSFAGELGKEPIDIFINNAGVYGPRNVGFGNVEAQDWLPVLQINAVAPLLLTQLLLENLKLGADKKLIYLTSKMGSIEDNQGGGAYIYRSSKVALNQVVKSISIDLAEAGFLAVVLHPGWVLTAMGGPNALIDTKTSVGGMIAVIDGLQPAASGGFYNFDGSVIPW